MKMNSIQVSVEIKETTLTETVSGHNELSVLTTDTDKRKVQEAQKCQTDWKI